MPSQPIEVVRDRLRREACLHPLGDVAIDKLGPDLEFAKIAVAEEGKQVVP